MGRDDWGRRDEQRRAEMRADERRREWQRQDRLRDERRREAVRDDQRREERRREERRQDEIREEERRRRQAADEKAQDENRKRGMSLIRDGFPDWGAAVLGLDPQRALPAPGGGPSGSGQPPRRATDWWSEPDRPQEPRRLAAPVLLRFEDAFAGSTRLAWTAIAGATEYVLQESLGPGFAPATEIYRGDSTEHVVDRGLGAGGRALRLRLALGPSALAPCYRVKAVAGPGSDSPWSSAA
jgi:hypothetical protein